MTERESLWTFLRRAVGITIGADFGVICALGAGLGLPLAMQVCAWVFFVPLGAVAGFYLSEAAT